MLSSLFKSIFNAKWIILKTMRKNWVSNNKKKSLNIMKISLERTSINPEGKIWWTTLIDYSLISFPACSHVSFASTSNLLLLNSMYVYFYSLSAELEMSTTACHASKERVSFVFSVSLTRCWIKICKKPRRRRRKIDIFSWEATRVV